MRMSRTQPAQLTFTEVLRTDGLGWDRTTVADTASEGDASGSGNGTNRNGSTVQLSLWQIGHWTTERNCAWKREYTMPVEDTEVPLSAALCSDFCSSSQDAALRFFHDLRSPSRDVAFCFGDVQTCFAANVWLQ